MGREPNTGDEARDERDALDAGDFGTWLDDTQAAIRGERDADVPCGSCTACCTSSQFVHIEPDEADALAHIPAELLFPAPRLPKGHVLLGYDEHGRCPMLGERGCSIYEHRPRTCRTYDCRVFAAADVAIDQADKQAIAERVRRWRFTHPRPDDRVRHDAVRAAARFLVDRREELPEDARPVNATQRAVAAIALHDAFIADAQPDVESVRVELTSGRRRADRSS